MNTAYKTDVIAWANEQAAFIRAGRFELLDLENIAEEIEDVSKSEQRELGSRMAVLLTHLLKWQLQPTHQCVSWQSTICGKRNIVARRVKNTPSFKYTLQDDDWWSDAWFDAVTQASKETGIELLKFPESCPWTAEQILSQEFFPD